MQRDVSMLIPHMSDGERRISSFRDSIVILFHLIVMSHTGVLLCVADEHFRDTAVVFAARIALERMLVIFVQLIVKPGAAVHCGLLLRRIDLAEFPHEELLEKAPEAVFLCIGI